MFFWLADYLFTSKKNNISSLRHAKVFHFDKIQISVQRRENDDVVSVTDLRTVCMRQSQLGNLWSRWESVIKPCKQ